MKALLALIPLAIILTAARKMTTLTKKPQKARAIKYIAIHVTATQQNTTLAALWQGWKARGFTRAGYHYLVWPDGRVEQLIDEGLISNGVANYNTPTVNVAYVGGIITGKPGDYHDTRTPQQKASLLQIVRELKGRYPGAIIQGHRDFPGVAKTCPNFNAKAEYANV